MKPLSAKAQFSDKAKALFGSEKQAREIVDGVLATRLKDGARSFKTGRYTVTTSKGKK